MLLFSLFVIDNKQIMGIFLTMKHVVFLDFLLHFVLISKTQSVFY